MYTYIRTEENPEELRLEYFHIPQLDPHEEGLKV